MSEFSITCPDFNEGEEIPRDCGYKHGNREPSIEFNEENLTNYFALIMDDPDAMKAVGKVWVHHLLFWVRIGQASGDHVEGKNDFGEIGYGGPAPPDGRHTYVFKGYALDTNLIHTLKKGFSKQELEDAMKGHILAEAKLTGTFAS
jgi:hypothetical protein